MGNKLAPAFSSTILLVNISDEGCAFLGRIVKPDWKLIACATVASAVSTLRRTAIPLMICDADATSVRWEDTLERISRLPDPPLFVVTSRLADDYLWAEALNLGAWDVMAQPFDGGEVIRIIDSALEHWQVRRDILERTIPRKAATATQYLTATGT